MAIDIYAGGKKERHKIWIDGKNDTLTFKAASKPDLVNVDGDKIILCKKTDNSYRNETKELRGRLGFRFGKHHILCHQEVSDHTKHIRYRK